MDDPERYSSCDLRPCINGEFIKADDYIAMKLKLTEQNKMLLIDIATLKKSIGSAVVAIENESDMDKASSLLTRALAAVEDFK